MFTAKVRKIKLNHAGFRQFRLHPLSVAAVAERGRRMAAAAGTGFAYEQSNSDSRARGVIYPTTRAAQKRDSTENVLLRSIGAGR